MIDLNPLIERVTSDTGSLHPKFQNILYGQVAKVLRGSSPCGA